MPPSGCSALMEWIPIKKKNWINYLPINYISLDCESMNVCHEIAQLLLGLFVLLLLANAPTLVEFLVLVLLGVELLLGIEL